MQYSKIGRITIFEKSEEVIEFLRVRVEFMKIILWKSKNFLFRLYSYWEFFLKKKEISFASYL